MAAAARHLVNPLATPEQVLHTPSREDGISEELETDLRACKSTRSITALKSEKLTVWIGAKQMERFSSSKRRFWYVSSMRSFSVKDIAASALFLSSKLEEHPIRIRDLINSFDYILKLVQWETGQLALERARSVAAGFSGSQETANHAGPSRHFEYEPMDYFAKEFYDWKDDIVIGESQILKRLGFNTTVQNPYGSIVNYLQVLNLTDHATIPQRSWSLANDFLLTPALALYPPHLISVACIYLSCLLASPQVTLPYSPAPWFELFDVETEEDIFQVSRLLLDLYQRWTGETDLSWLKGSEDDSAHSHPLRTWTSIWKKAAEFKLPLTREEVRSILKAQ